MTTLRYVLVCALVLRVGLCNAEEERGAATAFETIPVESSEPADKPPASKDAGSVTQLEDVVVTATKRQVSNRELTQTVDAITGDKIEKAGIHDITQLIERAPGVTIEKNEAATGGQPTISIRGVSSSFNTNSTAGLYLDETPLADVGFTVALADISPFDLSTVEILKGPVGTLFGGSSLNGAIRYIPQKPVLGAWQGRSFAEMRKTAQSDGLSYVWGLVANAPIGDAYAARVMYEQQSFAGIVDNLNPSVMQKDADTKKQHTLRASLSATPVERLSLGLTYLDQHSHVGDNGLVQLDQNPDLKFQKYVGSVPSLGNTDVRILQAKAGWAFDWADLSLTAGGANKAFQGSLDTGAYETGNPPETASPVPLLFSVVDSWAKPRFQELRLVSTSGGRLEWAVGVYNYLNKLQVNIETSTAHNAAGAALADLLRSLGLTQNIISQNGGLESISAFIQGSTGERAAFADLAWRFLPHFEINGGIRLFEFFYDVDYQYRAAYCVLAVTSCDPLTQEGDLILAAKERGLSPKLSLKWHASRSFMTYFTASRGFRFGGLNLSVPDPIEPPPKTYKSDALWNYEVGLRSDWLQRTLIADVTAFYINWTDAQFNTSTSDGLSTYTTNAGTVKGKGIEGNLRWNTPLKGVSVDAGAIVEQLKTADSFPTNSSTSIGPGQQWPLSPKFQGTATLTWTGYMLDRVFSAGTTFNYRGKAPQGFLPQEKGVDIFGYWTLDAVLSLTALQHSWLPNVTLNFNNLTDRRGVVFRIVAADQNFPSMAKFIPPRNASLRFAWEW